MPDETTPVPLDESEEPTVVVGNPSLDGAPTPFQDLLHLTPKQEDALADPIAVSPTGTPVIPQVAVRVAAAVVGIAGVLMTTLPPHTVGFRLCAGIVALGTMLGIASPGVRK
jgi:hypothetical protein